MRTALAVALTGGVLAAAPPPDVVARLDPITIPAQTRSFTTKVDLAGARERLLAADPASVVVLDLDHIEAERSPAVYFEIYVHSVDAARGESVGNLALFGAGIRNEASGEFRPAHVRLTITSQLRDALRQSPSVALTFVAQGAGGVPTPRSAAAVEIKKPAIVVESRGGG
jgi:hypothetical protein